jgi:hypothetical protein
VPGTLERDPRYVTPRMRDLRDEGLLALVQPVVSIAQVPRFAESFLAYLDTDRQVQERRDKPLKELSLARIHVWKLGALADSLTELGLAERVCGPGWELWLDLEERTADLFMAYLAATLGGLEEIAMDPVTNRKQAMAACLGSTCGRG